MVRDLGMSGLFLPQEVPIEQASAAGHPEMRVRTAYCMNTRMSARWRRVSTHLR